MSTLKATTTSIRLPPELRQRLEEPARRRAAGRTGSVLRALEEYLAKGDGRAFVKEARRQSVRASEGVTPDEVFWEEAAESGGEAVREEIALKKLNKLAHEWTRRNPNPLA